MIIVLKHDADVNAEIHSPWNDKVIHDYVLKDFYTAKSGGKPFLLIVGGHSNAPEGTITVLKIEFERVSYWILCDWNVCLNFKRYEMAIRVYGCISYLQFFLDLLWETDNETWKQIKYSASVKFIIIIISKQLFEQWN